MIMEQMLIAKFGQEKVTFAVVRVTSIEDRLPGRPRCSIAQGSGYKSRDG